jgi:type IV pilus assembly protein PilY1
LKPRNIILTLFLAVLLAAGAQTGPAYGGMTDYCQVPPYVIQNIPPNVLILLDISGSMLNNAYSDGYQTPTDPSDDRSCTSSNRCTEYNWTGRPSTHRYYGYYDPDQWYIYSSNKFSPSGPTTRAKTSSEWSGDFLNWLTMRRIDVMRKVLTGGRPNGSYIDGEVPDDAVRGLYKEITAAEADANTPYGNTAVYFVFDTGNSGTSNFDVRRVSNGNSLASSVRVNVQVPLPVEGVLQTVVGARARVGLAFYNTNDGGQVIANVGKDVAGKSSLSETINQVNLSRPSTNTPLAEALWTATGYFAQQSAIAGYASPSGTDPDYSNDYGTTNNADPMNFGTGGSPRWPVCQKNFILLLTDGEPCSDGKIPTAVRDYANGGFQCKVGLDYQTCPALSGTGWSFTGSSLVNPLCSGSGVKSSHGDESGVEDVALFMHTTDLRNASTIGTDNIAGFQNLTLYTVFAFGKGSTLLKYASINGGFENSGPADRPSTGVPSNWDKNGDGVPDTYFEATEGSELERAVRDAFSGILKRASSGTAASVLASGEGSGANLIQAVFYPRRRFGNDLVWWTGSLQNLWYFVDPFFANATIREETTVDSKLNLSNDYIAQFFYDPVAELTKVRRWTDPDGDGVANAPAPTVDFENMSSLWEAGRKLWERDLSSSPRTIHTNLDGAQAMTDFTVGNAAALSPFLMPDAGDDAAEIIRYVTGIDNTDDLSLRPRTATIVADNNVWKLGDVVNSTPRIVAGIPLNKYDSVYFDTTYKTFIDNTEYKNRGMVFTGGNDGMLHAFRLGKLELKWTSPAQAATEKARITNPDAGTILGDEAWAFIPKNALPYLKYLKDPEYCHLYYVDLAPYVFDASVNGDPTDVRTANSWRTVIIGGMRTGGACDNTVGCTTANNCVKTPGGGAVGFSSYFALDVTDPSDPSLMWEFSSSSLGFTTTGPAVVRINAVSDPLATPPTRDRNLNGEWYVVFGSGPTGPIDNTNNQFLGRSNQNLRFFVLNLKTGALVQTIDTGISNAFAGSMINSVADFNLDYQDDAIYVGYVKRAGSSPNYTWTDGGVGRILTKNLTPGSGVWAWSRVIDGIGPVSSSVARLQNKNFSTNWLFFGTGRYYFENPPSGSVTTPEVDDATGQRRLFGMREPCFTASNMINMACTTTVSFSTSDPLFPNVTDIANVPSESTANGSAFKGWFVDLEGSGNYVYDNAAARLFRSERVITDPLATVSGLVFFTTYKPYGDECALGGKSFLWALRYNTGDAPSSAVLKGKALVQVSTASVEQIDLSTAFQPEDGEGPGGLHKDGRRTASVEGVPPTSQGLSLLSQPPPVKRIMHMMER